MKHSPEEVSFWRDDHKTASERLTKSEYNAVSNPSYALGIVSGIEKVATKLRNKAGEAFSRGADAEAKLLRDLANEYDALKASEREIYDHNFPRPR